MDRPPSQDETKLFLNPYLWKLTNILSFKARRFTSLSCEESIPVSSFAFVQEVFANAVFMAIIPSKMEDVVMFDQQKTKQVKISQN